MDVKIKLNGKLITDSVDQDMVLLDFCRKHNCFSISYIASHLMSCSFIKAMRHSLSESSALHASPQPADMTDGRGIVRPGIPHALPLISSFNGAVVVSKVMISRFFFSLAKFLSITSHLV